MAVVVVRVATAVVVYTVANRHRMRWGVIGKGKARKRCCLRCNSVRDSASVRLDFWPLMSKMKKARTCIMLGRNGCPE